MTNQPPLPEVESGSTSDISLVAFLRQHRPIAPAPANTLETQLMQTIAVQQQMQQASRSRQLTRLVPVAIALIAAIGWVGSRLAAPPTLTPQEIAELESFVETAWTGSADNETDSLIGLGY